MNMTTVPSNQLKAMQHEIASLKEQVAHWKNNHETEVRRAMVLKERTDMPLERVHAYDKWGNDQETIAQQAEAIRVKDAALIAVRDDLELRMQIAEEESLNISNSVLDQMCDAIDIQSSPEILQARDERVAEACAKVCIEQSEGIARSTPVSRDRVHTMFKGIARPATVIDCSESSVRESAFRIRNGAWERHL